jgi:hypothetical protein
MSAELNAKWKVTPDVRVRINQDGGVLLDLRRGIFFGLNVTGCKIWEILNGRAAGARLQDIVQALELEPGSGAKEAETDVVDFVSELERQGLVQRA